MLVVLSPTKKQRHSTLPSYSQPLFFYDAQKIIHLLQSKSLHEIKSIYKISDKLSATTYDMIHDTRTSPALFLYQGEAFKALGADTLSEEPLHYASDHLRIFSSVYGLLSPYDEIQSYRLDFLTPFDVDLKALWAPKVTQALNNLNQPILNCASKEFSQLIQRDKLHVPIYDIEFLTQKPNQEPVILSTYAKHARGLFTRYILEHRVQSLDDVKQFNLEGYTFKSMHDTTIQFVKEHP